MSYDVSNPCGVNVGVGVIQSIKNVRIGTILNKTNAVEDSWKYMEDWAIQKWIGYPNGERYGDYDAILQISNSSGLVFQFNSYDESIPLPVKNI
jgi:hypothetical protein